MTQCVYRKTKYIFRNVYTKMLIFTLYPLSVKNVLIIGHILIICWAITAYTKFCHFYSIRLHMY